MWDELLILLTLQLQHIEEKPGIVPAHRHQLCLFSDLWDDDRNILLPPGREPFLHRIGAFDLNREKYFPRDILGVKIITVQELFHDFLFLPALRSSHVEVMATDYFPVAH